MAAEFKVSDSLNWINARICELQLARTMLDSEDLVAVGAAQIDKTVDKFLEESTRLLTVMHADDLVAISQRLTT